MSEPFQVRHAPSAEEFCAAVLPVMRDNLFARAPSEELDAALRVFVEYALIPEMPRFIQRFADHFAEAAAMATALEAGIVIGIEIAAQRARKLSAGNGGRA